MSDLYLLVRNVLRKDITKAETELLYEAFNDGDFTDTLIVDLAENYDGWQLLKKEAPELERILYEACAATKHGYIEVSEEA